jgi:hypothetical protein
MLHALDRHHDAIPAGGAGAEQLLQAAAVLVEHLPHCGLDVFGPDRGKGGQGSGAQQGVVHADHSTASAPPDSAERALQQPAQREHGSHETRECQQGLPPVAPDEIVVGQCGHEEQPATLRPA